ncbi:MAG: Hsp20/alpha crystallin family protein [Deltaproteobacteria bacterium]|nr:Hsp20/alpha crystallin family protein [Deltaproteobacteria bacterium]
MIRSIPPRTMLGKLRGEKDENRPGGVLRSAKPKEWVYETKPAFKRVKAPLIDVFREAEEVRIIMDLSGFSRGEIDIDIQPDRYIISAVKGEQVLREEILIPQDVNPSAVEENYKNGILELVLPREKKAAEDK